MTQKVTSWLEKWKRDENPPSGLLLLVWWTFGRHLPQAGFHVNINNIWVWRNHIHHKASLFSFKFVFPIVVTVVTAVSIPVLVYRYCFIVEDLNDKRWSLSSASAGSEREAGLAGPGITGGKEGRTERSREWWDCKKFMFQQSGV